MPAPYFGKMLKNAGVLRLRKIENGRLRARRRCARFFRALRLDGRGEWECGGPSYATSARGVACLSWCKPGMSSVFGHTSLPHMCLCV